MTAPRVSRAEKDWGLPRLTADEGARILGLDPGVFWLWIVGTLKPTASQVSKWPKDLPEAILRLYLTWKLDPSIVTRTAPPERPESPEVVLTTAKGRRSVQRDNKRRRA